VLSFYSEFDRDSMINWCGVVEIWHADLEGFKGWKNWLKAYFIFF